MNETIPHGEKITGDEQIEQALHNVEQGDNLTIAAGIGTDDPYKDERYVQYVDDNGDFQFGEPVDTVGRIIDVSASAVYEVGVSPQQPLINVKSIDAVWIWDDEE